LASLRLSQLCHSEGSTWQPSARDVTAGRSR
jgi:hypothetical protein